MTTDLWILLAVVFLHWLLIVGAALPRMFAQGIGWSLGPRDGEGKEAPVIAQRLQRASANLAENLPIFATVVLVVAVAGESNGTSALGAWIFLLGRLAHPMLYMVGIPMLRSAAWMVSLVGIAMVASVLF